MEREVGGGIGMGNTCKPMVVSFQCMKKSTTNKKIKKNEDNLRGLWDNVKGPSIQIIGVAEKDKKKGHENILEEMIV